MDDNLAIFLVLTMSIVAAVLLVLAGMRSRTARVRAVAAPEIGQLAEENGALRGHVARLEERLAVLERIATDPAERTAREIELLR
jgi:uncharacterized protein (UPF0548 family)